MVFSASPLVVWQYLLFENGLSANLVSQIMPISSIWKRDFLFLGLWWQPLENNANIFSLKTGFPLFFLACDGNLWKIMPISSIWKRDFRWFFLGLWWQPHLKTGFPCLFGLFWKKCQYLLFENGISLFLGLWWEPLENNANIFYLKTEFPCFFWACDGNLIWKRDFRVFLGLWWEPLENNANIFYLKTGFPFFLGLWWEPLENNANIFSLKTGFPLFFFGLLWQPLENNINIFYLKTEFPCFVWACGGNLIWKRDFHVFLGFSGK